MGWESSGVVGFDLGPLLQGQIRTAKLKSACNSLIIGPRGLGWHIDMGWESSGVVGFDLGRSNEDPWAGNPIIGNWAGNLLVWSDLTLAPSFKVK